MNKKVIVPVIALAALAVGAFFKFRSEPAPSNLLTLHGNVDIRQVELAFNASGRIIEVLAREGDRVAAGQVLARLDTERLKLALQQAQAQATAQRQIVTRLQAGSRPQEIRQARAQSEAARAAADDARHLYQRQQELAARQFISQQQADSARFALDKALAQWQAAQETARLVELGPRPEDIASARAVLAANEASVAQLQHDLAEGELRAPSAGVIDKRVLEAGDMASPQKTAFTLALTEPLWIRVWLPEAQLGRVPPGALASISTDSHPGKMYRGWVGHVSPSAEFTPKSVETADVRSSLVYQARVYVCAGAGELRQGMPAVVGIRLDQPAAPASAPAPACQDTPAAR